ncbi:hypothetical protein [Castellaniella sp.]|uniref:hypothetical protein n=1 Tax=Castellaniella sp. TaxID=1955812 RepID=UPI002AFF1A2F|nr:hypothetical protein [Castellaniella sp.]
MKGDPLGSDYERMAAFVAALAATLDEAQKARQKVARLEAENSELRTMVLAAGLDPEAGLKARWYKAAY